MAESSKTHHFIPVIIFPSKVIHLKMFLRVRTFEKNIFFSEFFFNLEKSQVCHCNTDISVI